MANKRNLYFDFLRGIAIIMVVAIHTFTIQGSCNALSLSLICRESLNFAVPLFLTISGIYAMRSFCKEGNYLSYLKRQIPKVYIPTIIWSIPWFALSIHSGSNVVENFVMLLSCGYSIFYFIALIIQMYCFLPICKNITMGGVILSGVVTFSSVALLTYRLSPIQPLVLQVGPCVYWLLFFAIGAYYSSNRRDYTLIFPFLLCIAGFFIQLVEYSWLSDIGKNGIGIKPSSWLYSLGAILVLISGKLEQLYKENTITKIVRIIGVNSFGIYLIHMLVLLFIQRLSIENWIVKLVLTLVTSLLIIKIIKKYLPQISIKYLGFK